MLTALSSEFNCLAVQTDSSPTWHRSWSTVERSLSRNLEATESYITKPPATLMSKYFPVSHFILTMRFTFLANLVSNSCFWDTLDGYPHRSPLNWAAKHLFCSKKDLWLINYSISENELLKGSSLLWTGERMWSIYYCLCSLVCCGWPQRLDISLTSSSAFYKVEKWITLGTWLKLLAF